MRLRNITGSKEYIAESPFVLHEPETYKGKWRERLGREGEIHIEIGMGKGQFIYELAKQNPNISYIGIEKYSSVLIRAIQKMEAEALPNLSFIRMDAEDMNEVFDTQEIDRIYLNFSDPWPKDRHAKRRLTSRQFLDRYDKILKAEGIIEFKTDNMELFDFSLEEVESSKWNLIKVTKDLHHNEEMMKGNIMTEYEEKFSSMGNPICKMVIAR